MLHEVWNVSQYQVFFSFTVNKVREGLVSEVTRTNGQKPKDEPFIQFHVLSDNGVLEYQSDGNGGRQISPFRWNSNIGFAFVPFRAFKIYAGYSHHVCIEYMARQFFN